MHPGNIHNADITDVKSRVDFFYLVIYHSVKAVYQHFWVYTFWVNFSLMERQVRFKKILNFDTEVNFL